MLEAKEIRNFFLWAFTKPHTDKIGCNIFKLVQLMALLPRNYQINHFVYTIDKKYDHFGIDAVSK